MRTGSISVIVPIFNAGPHLMECLNSILSQSHEDFEVICVNDGSSDNSGEILAEFERRDERIRVFTQTNRGVSSARNLGLEHARGEYLAFVDSDDSLAKSYLSRLMSAAGDGVDLVIESNFLKKSHYVFPKTSEYLEWGLRRGVINAPARKLFRRQVVEMGGTRFDHQTSLGEDLLFNVEILQHTRTVVGLGGELYELRATEGSLTRSYRDRKYDELSYVHSRLRVLVDWEVDRSLASILSYLKIKSLISCVRNLERPEAGLSKKAIKPAAKAMQLANTQLSVHEGDFVMRALAISYQFFGLYRTTQFVKLAQSLGILLKKILH